MEAETTIIYKFKYLPMKTFICLIGICFSSFYINGQNKLTEQYFFNKAVDLIIENSVLSLEGHHFFISYQKNDKKSFQENFANFIPIGLKLDTKHTIKFIDNLNLANQHQIFILDDKLFSAFNFEKFNYFKIMISDAIKFTKDNKSGFILIFKTAFHEESGFTFDNLGMVYGWVNRSGYFEKVEYQDGILQSEPYIPLIFMD